MTDDEKSYFLSLELQHITNRGEWERFLQTYVDDIAAKTNLMPKYRDLTSYNSASGTAYFPMSQKGTLKTTGAELPAEIMADFQ